MEEYENKRSFLVIIAKNVPNLLLKIIEIISLNKLNITSFNGDLIDIELNISRITIELKTKKETVEKICSEIVKIPYAVKVFEAGFNGLNPVQRELALIKFTGEKEERGEVIRLINDYNGRLIDFTENSIIFEIVKDKKELYHLLTILEVFGEVECTKTGALAITRGDDKFKI